MVRLGFILGTSRYAKIKKKEFGYVFHVPGTYTEVSYKVPYAGKYHYGYGMFIEVPMFHSFEVSSPCILPWGISS